MKLAKVREMLPSWQSSLLAIAAAFLLMLAFPDFEFPFHAWFAFLPLFSAIQCEKDSVIRSFITGWVFGLVFFFATCWWLTFAPITYAGFPAVLANFLLFCVCVAVAVFPGIFAAVMGVLLRRFGAKAMLAMPFVWIFTEFLRYWLTGNNWNAIGYSQAFTSNIALASYGGVYLTALPILGFQSVLMAFLYGRAKNQAAPSEDDASAFGEPVGPRSVLLWYLKLAVVGALALVFVWIASNFPLPPLPKNDLAAKVVALQPNVPMSGLTYGKWQELRHSHVRMAESALAKMERDERYPVTVIFPESPMNFMYEDDPETKAFINGFAAKNNVSVLFNSAEPNHADGKFYNSAVMVSPEGREVAQYDKIYLLPFGEAVPVPLESIVPVFVGSFSYGTEYDLLPLGEARAGVMICFESHFGQLSRQYVRDGADVIIEMTNDGYLGDTPVLRQHLANAVFRAVETNRPVLRVTNVGITAYIDERGEVRDPAPVYQEDTRVWTVAKSDGSQTFYVRYGDWFAWLCSIVTLGLLLFAWRKPSQE